VGCVLAHARLQLVRGHQFAGRATSSLSGKPRTSATILNPLAELVLSSVSVRGCMPAVVAVVTQIDTQWLAAGGLFVPKPSRGASC
jgi:hypothetical protein